VIALSLTSADLRARPAHAIGTSTPRPQRDEAGATAQGGDEGEVREGLNSNHVLTLAMSGFGVSGFCACSLSRTSTRRGATCS
jgi:hypothetical protein